MTALITLLVVLALSFLVTKVATIALTHTGLSKESARFQARSAFSGAGFTTTESESVVTHPVRRRIIMVLILLGNAGIVTVVGTLILAFVGPTTMGENLARFGALAAGVAILWFVGTSRWFDHRLSKIIEWALQRWTNLDTRDYQSLLHLVGDYQIMRYRVETSDWCSGRKLQELRLNREGILVLGVERETGAYLGAPRGESEVLPGDVLLLYGRREAVEELDSRPRGHLGELAHQEATREQEEVEAQEAQEAEVAG